MIVFDDRISYIIRSCMIVFEEYKKILGMERTRRRLEMEMERSDETRTLKGELKKKRQQRRTASKPYSKKGKKQRNRTVMVRVRKYHILNTTDYKDKRKISEIKLR